jgi:pSer/pThr/pTyr-binding forkhead associated (FHA) protein
MDDATRLEVRQIGQPPRTVPLAAAVGGEITIGRDIGEATPDHHILIAGDATISELHLIVQRKSIGWCVQVPAVTNGVFINGVRMMDGAVKKLKPDDEIRIGAKTSLIYRSLERRTPTQTAGATPELTPAERRVLVALCRPLRNGDRITEPTSVVKIAEELFVSINAVKNHLARLYLKFEIPEKEPGVDSRRSQLANEAIDRGAVHLSDF